MATFRKKNWLGKKTLVSLPLGAKKKRWFREISNRLLVVGLEKKENGELTEVQEKIYKSKVISKNNALEKQSCESDSFKVNRLGKSGARDSKLTEIKNGAREDAAITLIALIISIIVMLILAGVSLSAIVGDNGILTQAQNATYQSSIAVLEEYMQELYVTNYKDFAESNSKLDGLLSKYSDYFYIPSVNGIGALKYITDSEGHAFYLIKKSNLPDEIKSQLQGGDAGEETYSDYQSLNDVYGITSDLKVYYCSSGVDSIMGIAKTDLDEDNPLREVFTSSKNNSFYNLLASYDYDNNGTITAEEVKSVKSLTIDSSSNITSFTDFYNLVSLQELTFDGVTLDNLNGLQNCANLNYVYFKSSTVADYSALSGVSKLQYLYLYDIDDSELSKLCNGIKDAEFSQLEYLAVVGNNSYISNEDVTTKVAFDKTISSKKITNLTPLLILSTTTKEAVKYLSIQCNDIDGDLNAIADYKNIYLLRCEYNNLTSLNGLENMNNLTYLCGAGNNLGTITVDGVETVENTDNGTSIKSLANKTKLEQVNLDNNINLSNVSHFENDIALKYLYLENCSTSMDISNIRDILTNCSPNYKIPVKFLTGTVYKLSDYYTPSEVTYKQLKNDLYENTYITHLNLEGITTDDQTGKTDNEKITNDRLNEILKSMTNLKYLTLKDSTALTSIDFIASDGVTGLIELDLRNTGVSGEESLTTLNKNATDLKTLRVSDGSDFKNIGETISRLRTGLYSYWFNNNMKILSNGSGLICTDFSIYKKLEDVIDLEYLYISEWGNYATYKDYAADYLDLKKCKNLKNVYVYCFYPTIYLPKSIENALSEGGGTFIVNENSISLYTLQNTLVNNQLHIQDFFNSLKNASNLNTLTICDYDSKLIESLNDYLNDKLQNVKKLNLSSTNFVKVSFKNLNGIEKFTKLQALTLNYTSANLDVSAFSSAEAIAGVDKSLTTLTLTNANINSISGLENLTNLTSLTLNNNNISNLKPLENLINLQTLDLSNNSIGDTSGYIDNDGKTQTVNNLQILANLNQNKSGSLTKLYLEGNSLITDEGKSLLKDSSLSWTARSGF